MSTAQKKKVMFFLPTLWYGGGERVVSEISPRLLETFEIVIVLFEKKIAYPFSGEILHLNVPLSANFFLRVYRWIPRFFAFRRIFKQERPDTVVTFGGGAALIAILLGARTIVRVDTFASTAKKGFWGIIYKIVARLFFNKAKKVIAVSKAAKEDLALHFGIEQEKIDVFYNPFDIEKIQKLSQAPLSEQEREMFSSPVIITMGRLVQGKGFEYLLDAFAQCKKKFPEIQLAFLGEGALEQKLQKKASELGLGRSIVFLGWQENPYKFLARAKVYVCASLWEGFPMSVVEALACGLPVVSSDCKSGPREILAPATDFRASATDFEQAEYGMLFPPGNAQALEHALTAFFSEPDLQERLRNVSQKRARDFSIQKMMPQWERLLLL